MNIVKEIILNNLIKLPIVRKWARKINNRTGINGEKVYVKKHVTYTPGMPGRNGLTCTWPISLPYYTLRRS
jgi:hypothetical protein